MDYEHYMQKALAEAEAAIAKDEFPVGCVIIYEGEALVTGSRTGTSGDISNEIDHAEIIAIKRMVDLGMEIDTSRASLFCTLEPCLMCFAAIILSGIKEIVYAYEDVMGGGTGCDLSTCSPLYKKSNISVVPNIMRQESLALFKTFFENPNNNYWRGSLLAEYTLNQD